MYKPEEMQAPPSQLQRQHWIPVNPSWLVSGGIVLLAVLPHQIPSAGRQVLRSDIGAVAFAVAAAWVTTKVTVLGIAMLILLAGVWFHKSAEGFEALNKDNVKSGKRWLVEQIMKEAPKGIQQRTADPAIQLDEIPDHDHRWEVELALEEHPEAIQDRPVSGPLEYDESQPSHPFGH